MNAIQNSKRPPLLTYLCIGSTIFGLLWVVMLVVLLIYSLQGNVPAPLFPGLVIEYLDAGYLFLTVFLGLILLGLTAIVLMWQMKKAGYYLYVAIKTTLYFMPVAIIGYNHLTFTGLLLTSIGISAYGVIFIGANAGVKN
jgi:hypothetical protein